MKAILTVGISASGKSTWADEHCRKTGAININRDNMRFTLFGHKDWSTYKFKSSVENFVTAVNLKIVEHCSVIQKDIVISDTNLHSGSRKSLISKLQSLGYEVSIKEFPIKLEEAQKRDTARTNGVGPQVLYRQWGQWLKYLSEDGRYKFYKPNKDLPSCIICDIDGTIAEMHNRKPFEWDKVYNDKPRDTIIDMVASLAITRNYQVVLLSGRDSAARSETERWLKDNYIEYSDLFMRAAGDNRRDSIIKTELLFSSVSPKYNVCAVVDDRPQMIRCWHDLKMPNIISVANPYVEF